MILSSLRAAKYRGVLPDRRPLCRYATFPPLPGESAPRGNGECGFCGSLIRHLWLAVCIQTTNDGTVSNSLAAEFAHDFLPVGREKSVIFSLPVHLCSAEHRWGRGMRVVRVDCVDGDDMDRIGCPTSCIVATVTIVTARAGCDSE